VNCAYGHGAGTGVRGMLVPCQNRNTTGSQSSVRKPPTLPGNSFPLRVVTYTRGKILQMAAVVNRWLALNGHMHAFRSVANIRGRRLSSSI
jgi:hypothetical protein